MKDFILSLFTINVYVVIAYDNYREKVKECRVFLDMNRAWRKKEELEETYGKHNVAMLSRDVIQ